MQDNLSNHDFSAFYEQLPADQVSALSRLGLNRRIPTKERLEKEILALLARRDAAHVKIHWQFSILSARSKLNFHYGKVQLDNQKFKET